MKADELRHYRRLARRFGRVLGAVQGDAVCCAGLTVSQAHALLEIEDRGETTVGELTQALRIGKSTVSKTVDALVDLGLVERIARPSDRRYNDLKLSSAGAAAAEAVHQFGDDVVGRTFEKIPREKHVTILECFEILVEASCAADAEGSSEADDQTNTVQATRRD